MKNLRAIFFSLMLAAIPLCALGDASDPVNPAGHVRGKKTGGYTIKIVGAYSGAGTSTVTATTVSISVQLKSPAGSTCTTCFDNMSRGTDDRFQGTACFESTTLTLAGRLDMPAATDPDQSPNQAITGRVTATFVDSSGKGGRLVAIQDPSSRSLVTDP